MKELEPISPKENFLKEMKGVIESSLPAEWDDETKRKSIERMSAAKTKSAAFTSIPMECRKNCPFLSTCEYVKEGRQPIGEACPYETAIVVNFMADYIEDLGINVDNWVEMSQIRDLVDQDVQMLRKSKYLAKEDFIQDNFVGFDSDGDPIVKRDLHPAIEWEDKIHKRKQVMLKQFLATREAKIKAGATVVDSAQQIANLVDTLRKIEKEEDRELKRELGIIEVDEYIVQDQLENND